MQATSNHHGIIPHLASWAFAGALLLAVAASGLAAGTETAPEFRVGLAAVDITPPPGIPMAGYYHERGADGVLDPLHAKAMAIESQGERAALVVLDLIVVTRAVTDAARAEI